MAQFSRLILTKKGQALIAKVMSGAENVAYTKIAASDFAYTEAELPELEELADIKQEVTPSRIDRTNETAIEIEAAFLNTELTAGYYVKAMGLYATDPEEGQILFAATVESSGGCYMPAYNGVTISGLYVKLITTVGNAENVTLEVEPAGLVTVGVLEATLNDLRKELRGEMEKSSHSHTNKDLLDKITQKKISSWDGKQEAEEGKGLSEENYTAVEKEKLQRIADNANAYTHPVHPAKAAGMYLITVDEQGHISAATPVTKADITALGIASTEAATPTAGYGINVTQKADGSSEIGLSDAKVVVSETQPAITEGKDIVWVVPPET